MRCWRRSNRICQLAAHFREDGGRRTSTRRTVHRLFPCEGASLGPNIKRGVFGQAISVSRGGRTRKIHALTNDQGRPAALALTPGQIADKAYDANRLRNWLKAKAFEPVIPSSATGTVPYPLDRNAYRRRNLIERMFGKLKNRRRITTPCDRLAANDLYFIRAVPKFDENRLQ